MYFDISDSRSAKNFVQEFMHWSEMDYVMNFIVDSERNFEIFWKKYHQKVESVDISNISFRAFHILGSLDECKEIKKNGLCNLQTVLSTDTILSRQLRNIGMIFDIKNHNIIFNGKAYCIDYEKYRNMPARFDSIYKGLKNIALRIYNDFSVNAFFYCADPKKYGSNIHKRPEFLMTLSKYFIQVKEIEHYWKEHSKSYKINVEVKLDQIKRFTFELDNYSDPPFSDWNELDDDMKIKKWMLFHALSGSSEKYLYCNDDAIITQDQIISIENLE